MAICNFCEKEMSDYQNVKTCAGNLTVGFPNGQELPSLTYHFDEPSGRCHDCGITHGGYHHPGCDVERCPRCEG